MNPKGFRNITLVVGVVAVLIVGVGYWVWIQKPIQLPMVSQHTSASVDKTASWKTYTNATYGYHIKYPLDWKVSAASVVSNGKDQEIWITHQNKAGTVDKKIVILAAVDSDGNLPYLRNAPTTSQATIAGGTHTVYLFPTPTDGRICNDIYWCSYFSIPIKHNGVWYVLSADYGADIYAGTYENIFSTFGFSSTESH